MPTVHSVGIAIALGFAVGLLYGNGSGGGTDSTLAGASASTKPVSLYPAITSNALGLQHAGARLAPHDPLLHPPPPPHGIDPYLLIGVISAPHSFARRSMLRSFAAASAGPSDQTVATEFVFGDRFYEDPPPLETQRRLAAEVAEYGDAVFVDAREKLPHVGKATEKSAAWWLNAPLRSKAKFFCKTDDDSLLHHEHLTAALAAAAAAAAEGSSKHPSSSHVLFSYVRWRGWLPSARFQACGGGWGGPIDCIRHMTDPREHCDLAEGPFPQGTGQLTCMSRSLALELATSKPFEQFLRVAMSRNDYGSKCATANECAAHPPGLHMWHHEDAGISYNAWKAAVAKNLTVSVVHMPEKGWIWPWFNPKIADAELSSRAILMHKVTPALLQQVLSTWKVDQRAPSDVFADCSQSCSQWGWQWARSQCEGTPPLSGTEGLPWRGFGGNTSLCKFDPSVHYRCCFLSTRRGKDL